MLALKPATGYVDGATVHGAVSRYIRELKRRGVDIEMTQNADGTYSDVNDAITEALVHGILGNLNGSGERYPIIGDERFIGPLELMTENEVLAAKDAARTTKKAFVWGHLDNDLGTEAPKTATK